VASANWARDALYRRGETVFIAFQLAALQWRMGSGHPDAEAAARARRAAGATIIYALAVIAVDGLTCEDATARTHRLRLLVQQWREALLFLATLPPEERDAAVNAALAAERETAPKRREDVFLCGSGVDGQRAAFARGSQREVPSANGVGRTVIHGDDPGYRPRFRPPEIYLSEQEAQRAVLPALVRSVLEGVRPPA
jgi:hypothetical protein